MDGQRFAFGIAIGFAWTLHCLAQPPSRESSTESRIGRSTDAHPQPHPWLATAPGEYVRLINRGNVQIKIDDSLLASHRKAALTRFDMKLDYKCIYATPTSATINGQSALLLDVRYTKRDINVSHNILIPSDFTPEDPWRNRLMRHEMDHVAITTDPRLAALVNGIFSRGFKIEAERIANPTFAASAYQARIDQFTNERVLELESLLQFQYDELDRMSSDGLKDLDDRLTFFQSLYDYESCRKYLSMATTGISREMWERWVKIDAKKLAAHYSLGR